MVQITHSRLLIVFPWFFSSVFKSSYPCLFTWSLFMVYVFFTRTYCFLINSNHRTIKQVWSCTFWHGKKKSINFLISSGWKIECFHQFNALSPTFYCVGACTNVLSEALYFVRIVILEKQTWTTAESYIDRGICRLRICFNELFTEVCFATRFMKWLHLGGMEKSFWLWVNEIPWRE